MNPRVNNKNRKESRKYPLQNKYIDVRRSEFEEDTNGSSNVLNDLDAFQSTLYFCAEKVGFINFGQPEFTCQFCFAELWTNGKSQQQMFHLAYKILLQSKPSHTKMNFNVEEDNQPQRFWELQILDRHLANNSVLHFPHSITRMTFKIKIHYGGQFVNDYVLYYQGGKVHNIANQDPDKWSLFEIHGIVQEDCNVKDKFRIWWYRNSDDKYISIYDDKDANEVYNYACAMNTEVELFVDHSCKGVVASNPTPIPDTISIPIPDPINIPATMVENVDDATGGGGNSVEGGSEHDGSDTRYYGDDSSEGEAAGVHFDDSEDERADGLDDGFDVDLEPPPPPPMVDVGCSRNIRTKTVAKRNTPKKANVIETGVDVVDDVEMEKTYESDELNSSDPDAEDGNKGTSFEFDSLIELSLILDCSEQNICGTFVTPFSISPWTPTFDLSNS
ncbi:hypothetical protein P8452_56755 [Trifolium repens]|nr:hypothetical protein P8452_56755 [Trifolium repens]